MGTREEMERLARKAFANCENEWASVVPYNGNGTKVFASAKGGSALTVQEHERAPEAALAALRVLAGEAEPSVPVSKLRELCERFDGAAREHADQGSADFATAIRGCSKNVRRLCDEAEKGGG